MLIVEAFAAANACILAPVRSARRGLLRKLSRVDLNPPVQGLGYPGSLSPASSEGNDQAVGIYFFFKNFPPRFPDKNNRTNIFAKNANVFRPPCTIWSRRGGCNRLPGLKIKGVLNSLDHPLALRGRSF